LNDTPLSQRGRCKQLNTNDIKMCCKEGSIPFTRSIDDEALTNECK